VDSGKSLELRGTPEQLAIAAWLSAELDRTTAPPTSAREYRAGTDDIVRVFYLTNTNTVQAINEVGTLIRTIAEVRRLFMFYEQRVLVVRDSPDQVALTEWMLGELDKPHTTAASSQPSAIYDYRPDSREGQVRIFYLPNAATIQDFQEIATLVRTISETRRIFTYNEPRAIVVRGTPDQLALDAWMFSELAKPATEQTQIAGIHEYKMPGTNGDIVRVFYLPLSETTQDLQKTATRIRTTAQIRRVFTYNARRAVALRGTVDQIALAQTMIQ
jgi:hypothetical protein